MAALTKEAELSTGGLGLFKALTGTKQKCWTLFCLSQEHALFGIKRLWGWWKTSEHEITLLEMVWGFCSWGWGLVRDGLSGKPSQTAEGHRGQGAGRVPVSRRQTCLLSIHEKCCHNFSTGEEWTQGIPFQRKGWTDCLAFIPPSPCPNLPREWLVETRARIMQ